ncbi:hypothetical protein Hanom_Chr16g01463901 [Helianthus anomalus]
MCICLNHTYELLFWNPTTTAFKRLSTPNSHGFYTNNLDVVSLYVDADDDYNVLHTKRRCSVFGVYVYSGEVDSKRNIPFITRKIQGDRLTTRSFHRNGSRSFSECKK